MPRPWPGAGLHHPKVDVWIGKMAMRIPRWLEVPYGSMQHFELNHKIQDKNDIQ